MLSEYFLSTRDGSLNIAEGPNNGPLLILLHGFTDRWQVFEPILPVLIEKWHVVCFDFRGHGRSAFSSDGYSAQRFYRDAEAVFLHFTASEPAILLGHSMGGAMALQLAVRYPERVSAFITGDSSFDMKTHIDVMNGRRNVKIFGMRRAAVRQMPEPPFDPEMLAYHAEGRVEEFFRDMADADLTQVSCPLLIVQASPQKGGLMTDHEFDLVRFLRPDFTCLRCDTGHDLEISLGPGSPFFKATLTFLENL